jgi:molybdenum cofactor cytidylyltransferase
VISGIVLAAGTSSRFGSTKQLVSVAGRPLAQHSIDALADAEVDEVIVVTGHHADAVEAALLLPPHGRFVRNPSYRDGQATSLAAALHEVGDSSEAAVVLMGDQPDVAPEVVRALIAGFRETRSQIVRAAYRDGPGPSLLSREIYGEAGHLSGDVGARMLAASHPEWVYEVRIDADVPRDVDTPQDLPESP